MKSVDCLFIGHNEMNFVQYEESIRRMGIESGAYRDLNLNFVYYNNKPSHVSEIFNIFSHCDYRFTGSSNPLSMGETFSAAIAYLGTWLANRGFTFDYVNSFQHQKEELAEKLGRLNILTVAIITTYYVSVLPIIEIVDFIRKYNQTAKIIVGGPFISTHALNQYPESLEYLLKNTIKADFYVNSSQGEATLVKIIHALKENLPLDQINNIYYKTDNGLLAATPLLEENNKLSKNMVNWELFTHSLGKYAAVRTAISCPFSCAFCGFPKHAGNYQTAEVEAVVRELNQLGKIGSIKSVHFIDDTFNVPLKRFKEILRGLIKNKYKFKWHSFLRCQYLDKEAVDLMKESGCEGVFLGLESGNNRILKNMNKMTTRDNYFQGIEWLMKNEIITFGNFIIGFPGETHETFQDTLQFIQQSGIEFYRAQLWYCEPITPIWKERNKYNLKGESFEWSHSTMDPRTACDLVDDMFLSIKNAVWVPQYNFDFDTLFHLLHRGMTLEQVKLFLMSFNQGVEEKISAGTTKEVSLEVVRNLKSVFQLTGKTEGIMEEEAQMIDRSDMTFEF